ncbi:uncharacterized protein LOC124975680 [Sciurus carolinensis]|uniref:uncharacterized protein LOC124975680 n=1 Tax=Sciurus carolinensis TaxID=30640 RepID=UPI001FB2C059|nr:uncharacterized protein LOC124975680 [Sciurus carolinensis]
MLRLRLQPRPSAWAPRSPRRGSLGTRDQQLEDTDRPTPSTQARVRGTGQEPSAAPGSPRGGRAAHRSVQPAPPLLRQARLRDPPARPGARLPPPRGRGGATTPDTRRRRLLQTLSRSLSVGTASKEGRRQGGRSEATTSTRHAPTRHRGTGPLDPTPGGEGSALGTRWTWNFLKIPELGGLQLGGRVSPRAGQTCRRKFRGP